MSTRRYCPDCDAALLYTGDDKDGTRTGLWCRSCWKLFDISQAVVRELRIDNQGREWELVNGEWQLCDEGKEL